MEKYATTTNNSKQLRIEDFEYRRLVVASNAQTASEEHLLRIFKPIWNEDYKICWGISKHGDSAKTRANRRSPWDTMHPGRKWAFDSAEDKKPLSEILADIREHIKANPPFNTKQELIAVSYTHLTLPTNREV